MPTKITRKILDFLVRNSELEFTQEEIVDGTGLKKAQINKSLGILTRGKLVNISRKEKIPTPPYRKPFYIINHDPRRFERAKELIVREDA